MRRRAPRPAGREPRHRVRGHARVLGAAAAGATQLRDPHRVAAGHCAGRGRAAADDAFYLFLQRAPAARGACGAQVRDLHVGAEGGGGAALPPLHHVRAVLPARPQLPHLPPALRSRRRAGGPPGRTSASESLAWRTREHGKENTNLYSLKTITFERRLRRRASNIIPSLIHRFSPVEES